MKKNFWARLLAGIFLIVIASTSQATIITTVAGIENLEWLEFDVTQGLSRDQVESTLLQAGQQYYGYEYATLAQTSALLDSYYVGNIKDVDDGWRISTATAAFNFLTDFTSTYSQILPTGVTFDREVNDGDPVTWNTYLLARFYYGSHVEIGWAGHTYSGSLGSVDMDGNPVAGHFLYNAGTDTIDSHSYQSNDFSHQMWANLLVRSTGEPVPEPATMFLFGTGLAGLVVSRLRNMKK